MRPSYPRSQLLPPGIMLRIVAFRENVVLARLKACGMVIPAGPCIRRAHCIDPGPELRR